MATHSKIRLVLNPKRQNKLGYVWLGILSLATVAAFPYFAELSQRPAYVIWPLWALAVVWITYKRWSRVWSMPNRFGWGVLTLGAVLLSIGWGRASDWLLGSGWLCTIAAFLASHQDIRHSGRSLIRIAPCWIVMLRLPILFQVWLDGAIWKCISVYGSWLLTNLGVVCRFSDSQVEIKDFEWTRPLLMDHPYSFMPMVGLAVVWFVWRSHPIFMLPFHVALASIWSVVATVAQSVAKICWKSFFDSDLTVGSGMHIVGVLSAAFVAILVISSERMLRIAFYPVPNDRFEFDHRNPILNVWNRLFLHFEFPQRRYSKETN